jgi:hypothetical protein
MALSPIARENASGGQLDHKARRKIGRELRDQTYSDFRKWALPMRLEEVLGRLN